ncbi:hypothetical protein Gasu2_59520 [Galdieria sulphuraria]|nr:hypothetical protein Gasu2_59520 [Galdieria sulphuraria]
MLPLANNTVKQVERLGGSSFVPQGEGFEAKESNVIPAVEDFTLCVACMEEVANVLFIPCEHSVICERCLCMLDNLLCPCCREQVLFFNLLPVKSKVVEDCTLNVPNMEWWTCDETSQVNNDKVSEYLEKNGAGKLFDGVLSPSASTLQFIGPFEGQECGWFCPCCENYHSREQIENSLMYPMEKLVQQRIEHERNIVKKTLQVWVCGSSFQVNERLIEVLSDIFPVDGAYVHNMTIVNNINNNNRTVGKEAVHVISKSLRKLPLLELSSRYKVANKEDHCPILNYEKPPVNICFQCGKYSPNCRFEGNSICFRNVRTWELFRYAKRKDSWYSPDLLLYCCYNDSEQSFYDILGLKRRLRDRYGFVCKELLVLLENSGLEGGKSCTSPEHFKDVFWQREQSSLTISSICKLLKEYEPEHTDLLDVSYVNLTDNPNYFRPLLKTIVRRAKVQRKQQNRSRSWISSHNTAASTVVSGDRNRNMGHSIASNGCRCM